MFAWLAENVVTIILLLIIAVAVFFAIRSIWLSKKAGGCIGCSDCKSCSHCSGNTNNKKAE